MSTSPIHIVMTPVRNEAWILRAFLTTTSQWADYIIIADQMSTDGCRDIYKEFPKVIVIDNKTSNFNESERQTMLIAKAREVADGRDTLLWGLDVDEIIPSNAFQTQDWTRIIKSKKGDVFYFHWAYILPDKKHYYITPKSMPWLFHDDGFEPHKNYVRNMHSMRIPYPKEENAIFYVKDFNILHFDHVNKNRRRSKDRFYMFVDWALNKKNVISLARTYFPNSLKLPIYDLKSDMLGAYLYNGNVWSYIDCDANICWMDDYIKDRLPLYPISELSKLPIWDEEFLNYIGIRDPRTSLQRLLHSYLRHTQKYKSNLVVRAIDKCLRPFFQFSKIS